VKKRRFLKFVIPIALVAVLALGIPLMGGCRPAPPEEVEPIKIGLVFPYSGMFGGSAWEGDKGVILATEDINARGGLLGRPVVIERFDVVNWELDNLVAARDYMLAQDVDVIDTLFGVVGLITEFDAYKVGGIPCLQYHTTEPFAEMIGADLDKYWNQLSYDDTGRNYGPNAYVGYTKLIPEIWGYEYPSKTVAVLTSDLAYSLDVSERFRALIAADPEWEEVYYSEFPFGGTEFGVQLTEIRALDPEPGLIMFIEVSTAGSAAFVMQFQTDPTNSLIHIQWGMADSDFHEALGELAVGIMGQGQPVSNPTTEFAEFEERFWERFDQICVGTGASLYDRYMGWAEAVETVGDVKAYRDIVDEMISMNYKGYTFGPDGWNTSPYTHNDRVELSPAVAEYVPELAHPEVLKGPTYGNNLHLFQSKWTTAKGSYPIPLLIQGYPTEEYMSTYYGYLPVGTAIGEVGTEFEVPPYFK